MPCALTRLSRVPLIASASALAFVGGALPVSAAPYYLKMEGVEGEAKAQAGRDPHKSWIEIESIEWGQRSAYSGGANVASGNVNNDSAGTKRGNVETEWKVEEGESAMPGATTPGWIGSRPCDGRAVCADPKPETTGLLVPGVQNIRGSMRGNYPQCRVGDHHDQVVATATDGRRIVLKDVTISACNRAGRDSGATGEPTESVSFNYSKID